MLIGHGVGDHDPDAEIVDVIAALLPWLVAA
jgi:hypothetical protein